MKLLDDLFYDKGRFSLSKFMTFFAFIFSSWVVYKNATSQYVVELLTIYLGLPYANRHATRYMNIKENTQSTKNLKNIEDL